MNHSCDLLLVYPNNRRSAYGLLAHGVAAVTVPVQMGLTAAYVRQAGFSIAVIDADAENLTPRRHCDSHCGNPVGFDSIFHGPIELWRCYENGCNK